MALFGSAIDLLKQLACVHMFLSTLYILIPQREWAEKMVESEAATSDTWYYTGLLLAQFKGLQQGYAKATPASRVSGYVVHISLSEIKTALGAMDYRFRTNYSCMYTVDTVCAVQISRFMELRKAYCVSA